MIKDKFLLIVEMFIFLCTIIIMFCHIRKMVKGGRIVIKHVIGMIVIILYLLAVFIFTIVVRERSERQYQLELLWSWKEIIGIKENARVYVASKMGLLQQNLLNIFMLFPVGVLLPIVDDGRVKKLTGLIVGMVISAVIEVLVLGLCRGLFEWDDIIHNSLGCMFGVILMNKLIEMRRKKMNKKMIRRRKRK